MCANRAHTILSVFFLWIKLMKTNCNSKATTSKSEQPSLREGLFIFGRHSFNFNERLLDLNYFFPDIIKNRWKSSLV